MTSEYNEKLNKLNIALENVYLKKANVINALEDILDDMIQSEPLQIIITNYWDEHGSFSNYQVSDFTTNEYYYYDENNDYHTYHDESTLTYTTYNNTITFIPPPNLPLEKIQLVIGNFSNYSGGWAVRLYFYDLVDYDNDRTITVNYWSLPRTPPTEE